MRVHKIFDHLHNQIAHATAKELKAEFSHLVIEASGGITSENITEYMGPHVDVISLSRTTQGYDMLDFSLKIVHEGHDPTNPQVTKA